MISTKKVGMTEKVPPHVFFLVSAIFHYLGPAFAVLLFAHVSVLGVAWCQWLRIANAAVVFALWRRPWRMFMIAPWATRRILIALGVVLGLMNACFYLAIAHIPLGTVGTIEFLCRLRREAARGRRGPLALRPGASRPWQPRFFGKLKSPAHSLLPL